MTFPQELYHRYYGAEFTSKALEAWAKDSGIKLHFITPGKPTENGYIESFNGKFGDECLNRHWFLDLADSRVTIEEWRTDYNLARPHSSSGYLTPLEFKQNLVSCPAIFDKYKEGYN